MDPSKDLSKKVRREDHLGFVRAELEGLRAGAAVVMALIAAGFITRWFLNEYFVPLCSQLPHIESRRGGILGSLSSFIIGVFGSRIMMVIIFPLMFFVMVVAFFYILYWILGLAIRSFMFLYTCMYDLFVRLRNGPSSAGQN